MCGTLLARADEVIERSGQLFEPRLIDNPGEVGFGSSTSFQAQAAHFRFSPSRPGEFHPEPLTEPDLILSHHPARATAGRLPPSAEIEGSSPCQLA